MPITENFKIVKEEGKVFPPLPENFYQVELLDITSKMNPTFDTRTKPVAEQEMERVLGFQFTLLAGKDKKGESLRGRNVWDNFIPSTLYISKKNGKNALYRITEALLGHELSPKEEAEMDSEFLNGLIGRQCRVGIKNVDKGGKIYDRIEVYYSADADLPALSEEEKENSRMKAKKEDEAKKTEEEYDNIGKPVIEYPEDPNPSDIPF